MRDLGTFHIDTEQLVTIRVQADVRVVAERPQEAAACGSTTASTGEWPRLRDASPEQLRRIVEALKRRDWAKGIPPLSPQQLSDLAVAHVAGEMSEGFLRDVLIQTNGMGWDQVRSLLFDAVERGKALADHFLSVRVGAMEATISASLESPKSSTPDTKSNSSTTEERSDS